MDLQQIFNESNEEKFTSLSQEYLNSSSQKKIREDLTKIHVDDYDNNFLLKFYEFVIRKYPKDSDILISIDFNIGLLQNTLNIESLYSFLILIRNVVDKTIDFHKSFNYAFEKICGNKQFSWMKIFNCLGDKKDNELDICKELFSEMISSYSNEYIKDFQFSKKKIILICKKLNYIMTIYHQKIIQLFNDLYINVKLSVNDLKEFFDLFLFNYPYECEKYCDKKDDDEFILYIKTYISKFNDQEKLKQSIKDLECSLQRVNEYEKRKYKLSKEITKQAKELSLIWKLCKSSTFIYGKTMAYVVSNDQIQTQALHEFEFSSSLPLEYLIDPVDYFAKTEETMELKVEEDEL